VIRRIVTFLRKFYPSEDHPHPEVNMIEKDDNSRVTKGEKAVITNCDITLINSNIILDDEVTLHGYNIVLTNSTLKVGKKSFLISNNPNCRNTLVINDGHMEVGDCSRIVAKEISIRWGGQLTIANYTAINEGCEIRCDENISIGNFVMISYECMIYDTNTHMIYNPEKRRELTISDYPYIGTEHEKPRTKPVIIGDDCWIGKRSTILKGVTLGKFVIVGTGSVVTTSVPDNMVCAGNPARALKSVVVS
jgi:acetyltransferase-like isoleucine patch superfamily enzyme